MRGAERGEGVGEEGEGGEKGGAKGRVGVEEAEGGQGRGDAVKSAVTTAGELMQPERTRTRRWKGGWSSAKEIFSSVLEVRERVLRPNKREGSGENPGKNGRRNAPARDGMLSQAMSRGLLSTASAMQTVVTPASFSRTSPTVSSSPRASSMMSTSEVRNLPPPGSRRRVLPRLTR